MFCAQLAGAGHQEAQARRFRGGMGRLASPERRLDGSEPRYYLSNAGAGMADTLA